MELWKGMSIMLSVFVIVICVTGFYCMSDLTDQLNVETLYKMIFFTIGASIINMILLLGHSYYLIYEKKKKLIDEGYIAKRGLK